MLGFLMVLESDGEREFLGAIYEEVLPDLQKAAGQFFPGNRAWAEESIADAFLSAAENFQSLQKKLSREEWLPYLTVCVRHNCLNILRREKRYVNLDETKLDPETGAEELKEDLALAVSAIRALKMEYREVLELRLILERSNREAAHFLGISEELASKRFQRSKALVAQRLNKEEETDGARYGMDRRVGI